MPTECIPEEFDFARVEGRRVFGGFDGGEMSSDAGGLLLGSTDRAIGLIDRFAACFRDARRAELVEHAVTTLVWQRVIGLALGYEDLSDHDELPRPDHGGAGGQAGGWSQGLCTGCRQEHAEPA